MTISSVLFVCLGNICRSPLAEAAFRYHAGKTNLAIQADSAGTGDWHIGNAPDPRAQAEAKRHGLDISGYKARQVTAQDFNRFSLIIAMDDSNLVNLRKIAPSGTGATLSLLFDYVPGKAGASVADPYYSDAAAFEKCWQDVNEGTLALIREIERVTTG